MSGGFNFSQVNTTGFTFGNQKTTATAPVTGFSMTSSAPAASGGGFTFVTNPQNNTNATATFGANPASTFGTNPSSTFGANPASTFGANPASTFGSTNPASTFGSTNPASTFGSTNPASTFGSTNPASTFGSTNPASTFGTTNPASTFGTTNPASTFGTNPAGNLGTNQAGTLSTNPAGTFSFGTPVKTISATGGFSFGTPTTTTFSLGSTPQTTTSGLTLGSTPSSGTGFTLGAGFSTQTTASAPAGGGFSFGNPLQSQVQSAAAAATTTTAAAAPPATTTSTGLSFGGFSFGAAKVQVTTPAVNTASSGGSFIFGGSTPSSTLTLSQPASTSAATTVQSGGLSFGVKPSLTPAPPVSTQAAQGGVESLFSLPVSTATAATTTLGTGFILGATSSSASTTIATTTTMASSGLAFSLKPLGAATTTTTAPATTSAATSASTSGFSLGFKPAATTITTTVTTSIIPTSTAPSVMTYAQLEGLINKWSLELEDQERHFLQQATQVNAWDRLLVENGDKITALHKEMEKVKLDQRRLNQELDFILSQQKELEDLLLPLEESVREQSGTVYMQNADEERERTYKLAENVDAQLKRMSQDLKEIIEHLNTSSGPADTSDPLQQICKILNAHMDSLQWIDQNSVLLQRRVEDVSKLCDNQRKEQEKTFRLTFD
ncbi:nucleoporin 62 like isoform X2 [Thalassophryne amazonica]|uniref:nucleoporin 62 like isoform X2 n=1 Tax=Thalassophryne amazonica TaxID=390379 RepID=UPI001471E1E0|nr:nucleoporin 62 like isoform X2 [Thalassophryne amazonica]